MKVPTILLAAALSTAFLGSCATKEPGEPQSWTTTRTGDRKIERARLVTTNATVRSIDPATRRITLLGPEGKEIEFIAGDEVRNFDQIKKGDRVTATYHESLVVEAKEPGQAVPGASATSEIERTVRGQKPSASGETEIHLTATVLGIDLEKGTITLKSPEGAEVTMKARDPKNLEKVKAGDLLEITYTVAVAVSIEETR